MRSGSGSPLPFFESDPWQIGRERFPKRALAMKEEDDTEE